MRDNYKLGGNAQIDTTKEKNFITEKMLKNMNFAFQDFEEAYGDGAGYATASALRPTVPGRADDPWCMRGPPPPRSSWGAFRRGAPCL